jgi:hypothetical protein
MAGPVHIKKSHEGRFTDWCKRNGFDGVSRAAITAGLKSQDTHVRKMAQFASTSRHWNH